MVSIFALRRTKLPAATEKFPREKENHNTHRFPHALPTCRRKLQQKTENKIVRRGAVVSADNLDLLLFIEIVFVFRVVFGG